MFEQNVTAGPGTGTFAHHTLEILIMLLGAFLLGLWLGWILWSRYKQMYDKMLLDMQSLQLSTEAMRTELNEIKGRSLHVETDNHELDVQISSLSRENDTLKARLLEMENDMNALRAHTRKLETELALALPPDTPADPVDIPLEIDEPVADTLPDDFADAEDAAPEPEIVLPADAIETELAGMGPVEEESHQIAFDIAPVVDPTPAEDTQPVEEITVMPVFGDEKDDLTVVEGIGPKIQELLFQYGIRTYAQLADTDVTRLKEILASAGPQLAMHDPGTWPSQANLAANGQWDSLKAIQGFLKGGKKPT
jgi:predicted flap endonuclease-1-like 5' DNA nuclease